MRLVKYVGVILLGFAISCSTATTKDLPPEAIDFFRGGDSFLKFRTAYDARVAELADACMRTQGFEDWREQLGLIVDDAPERAPLETQYFGIVDGLEYVKTAAPPAPSPDPVELDPKLRAALDLALNEPERGCSSQAESEARDEFRIDELANIEIAIAEQGRELQIGRSHQERVDEWSHCMALNGIDVANPGEIHDMVMQAWIDEQANGPNGTALDIERTIYAADQQCPNPSRPELPPELAESLAEEHRDFAESIAQHITTP